MEKILLGFVKLMELAVDLREPQIRVRIVAVVFRNLLVHGQRIRKLLFGEQRLAEPALVVYFGRIESHRLAIDFFGFGQIFRLGVSVAQKTQQRGGRRSVLNDSFEQCDRVRRFALVQEKLRQLFDGLLVLRVRLQDATEDLLRFLVRILQTI